jgi:hypothetical protein
MPELTSMRRMSKLLESTQRYASTAMRVITPDDQTCGQRAQTHHTWSQRVDYWPVAISGERGNGNDACFAETVWAG